MTQKSINEYTVKGIVNDNDFTVIGKSGTTYKISIASLISNLQKESLKLNMGSENEGKMLSIDVDGNIALVDSIIQGG